MPNESTPPDSVRSAQSSLFDEMRALQKMEVIKTADDVRRVICCLKKLLAKGVDCQRDLSEQKGFLALVLEMVCGDLLMLSLDEGRSVSNMLKTLDDTIEGVPEAMVEKTLLDVGVATSTALTS